MAWNDPPSFDYQQQLSGSGRKLFKHRYVANDTKLGQQLSSGLQYNQAGPQQHLSHQAPISHVNQQTNITQHQHQHHQQLQPELQPQQQPQMNQFNQQPFSQATHFHQQQPYNNGDPNYPTNNNFGQDTNYGISNMNQAQMMFQSPPQGSATVPPYHPQQ